MSVEILEPVTVEGDGLTLSLIVWRRFNRHMPGVVERALEINPGLADQGPYLPFGLSFNLPVPIPRDQGAPVPIKLW